MLRQKILLLVLFCVLAGFNPARGWGSQDELKEACQLNDEVGQLSRAGRFQQALPLAQKALQIRYKNLGPEHPETAISLTSLGLIYQEIGSLNDALPLLERALQIRYKALGPADPGTAASLNNLAELYRAMGAYDKALPLFERALRIRERVSGPEHPDTASTINNLALFYQNKGEIDKALPLFERALKIREKTLIPNSPDIAVSLNNLAEVYRLQAAYDKSLMYHERALRINERVLGSFHPATALSLTNLATLFDDMGFYTKAQPLYERALQIREKSLGLEHLGTAQSLNNLAMVYHHLKQPDKALPLYERALAIREKAAGPEHPDTAATLNDLASLFKDTGEPEKALGLYERALKIRENAQGQEHADTLATLNNLAALHQSLGALAKAVPLYERVVKSKEKTLGPEHLDLAASLGNLAQAYQALGEFDKALPVARRLVKIREKALGTEHPDTLASLNSLAAIYTDSGAYEKSVPVYERVLKMREKTPGPEHPETAVSLNNLALAYQGLGEYDKALSLYNRSLKIKETAPDPEQPTTAKTLVNLASLHQAMGTYSQARPLYERAIRIREKALGPDHPDTASALDNLAGLFVVLGEYDQAQSLYERTLKIFEKAKGANQLDTAVSSYKLAALEQVMGNEDKALILYNRAAKIFEKILGADHPDTSRVLAHLGLAHLARNESEKAEEFLKKVKSKDIRVDLALSQGRVEEAWQLLDGMTPPLASTPEYHVYLLTQKGRALAGVGRLPEAAVALWQAVQGSEKKPLKQLKYPNWLPQAKDTLRPHRTLVHVLAQMAQKGEDLPPELQEFGPTTQAAAFSLAEATKNRILLESLGKAPGSPTRAEIPSDLRQREEVLQLKLAAHEAQWEKAVTGSQEALKEVIANRKKLNANYEELISELRQTHPLYAGLYYPGIMPVRDVPLADNEVLIEYALGEEASHIFVVRRDGVQYLHSLPLDRKTLEAKIRKFMAPLMNGRDGEISLKEGEELYDLLLAKPLATVSPGEQVIIIPDGILGALPFESLIVAAGIDAATSVFVGDQRVLTYYPSATVLAQQRGRAEKPATRPLLALGKPVIAVEAPPQSEKKKKSAATETAILPEQIDGTDKSLLATHAAWGPTTRGKTGKQGIILSAQPEAEAIIQELARLFEVEPVAPDVLLGRQATEAGLRQSPLHDYRYVHFGTHAELTDKIQGLLTPFILLSKTDKSTPDDGFLKLNEVLELDLGAQIVVLAHGRTGRGQALEGDGVIDLARAFQYAGARSVLVSLWDVKPEAAQEFLLKFYGRLKEGKSRSEALRLARFDVRMQYPDPMYWAAWVLYGES